MLYQDIALWGDSIGRGIDFDPGRGRYAVLSGAFCKLLEERGILRIDNHARFGATVTEGLEDFEATATLGARCVAIQYAGNDCNLDWAAVAREPSLEHPAKTPLPLFEQTLRRFVARVRERGHLPLLVTSPPLYAQRFVAWVSQGIDKANILGYLGDEQHVYRWQERYAVAVHRVAQDMGVRLFDLRDAFLAAADFPALCGVDGMHPNQAGHQMIAQAVEAALKGQG
ncbi:MAG: SGNH/GDSL hydrolase family protein [Christensenellales bacterium]